MSKRPYDDEDFVQFWGRAVGAGIAIVSIMLVVLGPLIIALVWALLTVIKLALGG